MDEQQYFGGRDRRWKKYASSNAKIKQQNYQQQKNIFTVNLIQIHSPIQFIIYQDFDKTFENKSKFRLRIIKDRSPPPKIYNHIDQLKTKLTPIQKIWSSYVKQYLNDSEFVEIYRKGKSLAFGKISYGKSIIQYVQNQKNNSTKESNQQYKSQIFSRAYFKLWEILNMGIFEEKQNESVRIGCLAEGPGGFIHALMDYRLKYHKQQDKYAAITLKMSQDTRNAKDWSYQKAQSHFNHMRKQGYEIKLSYGSDGAGNLLLQQNINYFAQEDLHKQKCYLVTGDGGIECIGDQQLHYQQVLNAKLFLSQIITALKIQQLGGKFILKIYDCAFELTKQLITLTCIFYRRVRIVKPVTSRPGNSQKYLLCEDFLGISEQQQGTLINLLKYWTQIQPNINYFQNKEYVLSILDFQSMQGYEQIQNKVIQANTYFLQEQGAKLQEGIRLVQENDSNLKQIGDKRYAQQIDYAYSWCQKYGIPTIQAYLSKII